jgi:hypothetical protein
MKFGEMIETLQRNIILIMVLIVILTPSIWGLATLYYGERIETLKEQVNLFRQEKQFLESKLKEPAQFPVYTKSESALEETSEQKEVIDSGEGKVRYPPIVNPNQLTKSEVRELARFYNLFNDWKVNPHLRFRDGDISYWYEQKLSDESLKREFNSRRIVLERAETTREIIPSQGDLSHRAEELQAQMR